MKDKQTGPITFNPRAALAKQMRLMAEWWEQSNCPGNALACREAAEYLEADGNG